MDVHLVHLVFIFYHHLGCILWTLWVPKVAGKITQHLRKVITIGAVAVSPSLLIFPRCSMVGHLRDKRFNNLKLVYLVFENIK